MASGTVDTGKLVEIAITYNTNYISESLTRCFTNGKFVIVSFNFKVSSDVPSRDNLFYGLPKPIYDFFGIINDNVNLSTLKVNTSGNIRNDVPIVNTGWHSGMLVYPI